MISLERKRSERSQRPFVLLLIENERNKSGDEPDRMLLDVAATLQSTIRETDVTGWYTTSSVVGVMFTEIVLDNTAVLGTIRSRISALLLEQLGPDQFSRMKFCFHVFPDDWESDYPNLPISSTLYPDLEKRQKLNRRGRVAKRVIDVLGSFLLLAFFSPLFFIIAAAVKLSSDGPVLFRQQRIGQHGTPFTFLKFRSMYMNNDPSEHKEYVRQLIAGHGENNHANRNGEVVFKLTSDRRITLVGSFLRRTSLDELPQLINVLRGDMSLVGPRPPVDYEVKAYKLWHRRRLLEAKPGITGLWQVSGRSRVKFDDMVRLDLKYARNWSPWMDIIILMRTPSAVLFGEGAH